MAADMAVKAPPAPAAAPTSPWDVAFGSAVMTNYMFRGISQSANKASLAAYTELRYNANPNLQWYAAISGESIDFPNHAAAEIDFYGGVRPTFGPLALDLGAWYYYYPGGETFNGLDGPESCTNLFITPLGGCNTIKGDLSFWEVYGHATYTFNDYVAAGANIFYSPSWLNSGAYGTYASGTLKLTAPSTWFPGGLGAYISGEAGYYWFGVTDSFYGNTFFPGGIQLPDYATWNVGLGFTYKVFTLDLRYWDTNLSKSNCDVLTSAQTASFNAGAFSTTNTSGLQSDWCGSTFVAKFSIDTTLSALK